MASRQTHSRAVAAGLIYSRALFHLLSALEQSTLCTWVRESGSLWAYPGFVFAHTLGMAMVVGLSVVIDLRVLGVARQLPLAPLERFFPFIWAGIWLSVVSGTVLFAAEATNRIASPLFGVKMTLVALAIANTIVLRRVVFRRSDDNAAVPPRGKALAALSFVLWSAVMVAGRLMTYLESTGRT